MIPIRIIPVRPLKGPETRADDEVTKRLNAIANHMDQLEALRKEKTRQFKVFKSRLIYGPERMSNFQKFEYQEMLSEIVDIEHQIDQLKERFMELKAGNQEQSNKK
jgi:uncharacterized protein Yka (UPF0111/DUF47 family)